MYGEIKSKLVRDLLIYLYRDLGVLHSDAEVEVLKAREKELYQALNLKSYRKVLELPHWWEATSDVDMDVNEKFQRAICRLKPLSLGSTMSFLYRYLNPRKLDFGDAPQRWELRELETKAIAVTTVWDLYDLNHMTDELLFYLKEFLVDMRDYTKHCFRIDKMLMERATVDILLRTLGEVHDSYHYANVK